MPVRQVTDGEALEPGEIFVIPPNALLTVVRGIFRVEPPGDDPRGPIDAFLRSLAEDRGQLSVGVVLSGTGDDGAIGLRSIREGGGLTLAQSPGTAKHPVMPQNAIASGFVDEALDVERIPARIFDHVGPLLGTGGAARCSEMEVRAALEKCCAILHRRTGHDFSHYKEGTLVRRVRRRMLLLHLSSMAGYLELLSEDPREPDLLLRDLLIGVTQFFREQAAFDALAEKVIARIIGERRADQPIRVWVPGCATGEEVYSIAMVFQEQLAISRVAHPVQIFATDIDRDALAAARAGRYRTDVSDVVSPERLERFFVPVDEGYQVAKELREMCVFSVHNLIRDPPFSALDLISCRNLLIYLEPVLQKKIIPLLHYALRPSGFLFLGSSEELSGHSNIFAAIDKKRRIFQRKETVVRPVVEFPLGGPPSSRGLSEITIPEKNVRNLKQAAHQGFERMLLQDFAPASAVIDDRGEMLCRAGRLEALLRPPAGLVSMNLLDHAQGALRHALRTALAEAVATRSEVVRPQVVADVGRTPHRLRVTVRPAPGAPSQSGLHAVILEDLGPVEGRVRRAAAKAVSPDPINSELREKVNEPGIANSDLQNLFSATEVATIFLDRELKLAKFTPAATTLFHFIDSDLGRPLSDLAPKFAGTDLLADVEEVIRTLAPVEREVRAGEAWFILRVLPYRNLDQSIAGAIVTFVDVTRLKRAESALRESERLLKEIIDGCPDAIFLKDLQGRFITVNRSLEGMLGTTRDQLRGKTDYDLFPRAQADYWREHDARVVETRSPIEIEEVADLPDGNHVFLASKFPLVDSEGRIYGVGAISHDITERRKAEELVRRYADLLRLSQEAIHVHRLDGEIEFWNKGAESLYGYSVGEARGKNVHALLHSSGLEAFAAAEECLAREGQWAGELVHRARDGRTVIVSARMQRLRGEDGVERVLQSSRDITERKLAEQALEESRQRLSAIVDSIADGFYAFDPLWRITHINDTALAYFGKSREEMLGHSLFELFPNLAGTEFETGFRQAMENRVAVRFQAQSLATPRTVELFAYPGRENVTVLFRDVTERELQVRRVARLTQLYSVLSQVNETIVRALDERQLLERVCHIIATKLDLPLVWIGLVEAGMVQPVASCGRAVDYLSSLQITLGGELGGGPTGTCIRENRPIINESFEGNQKMSPWREAASRYGLKASAAFPLRRHDLTVGALTLYSEEKASFDSEQIELLAALSEDISYALDAMEAAHALRRSETSLREADARKNEFLAMLSHELRNPLTPIKNSLYLLDRTRGEGEQARRGWTVIERQVAHMSRLVDDLLDVTRVSRGKIQLVKAPIDLDEVMDRTVEDHRDLFARNGIELRYRPAGSRLSMDADRTRIAQVLGNLLQNAQKFTPRGGWTEVQVERRDGQVAIKVRDNGAGIGEDILPFIFEPFTQADRTLDRSRGGLGLGLALVKALVELHGGSVRASSGGPGRGAEFQILLPLLPGPAPLPAPEPTPVPRARLRVLIIEDNRDAADTLREVLELDQHFPLVAYSGPDGIQKAKVFLPDVVLCDIGLPEMNGFQVARALRSEPSFAKTTLVALTGYASAEDVAKSRTAGFDRHLSKPVSMEALQALFADVSPRIDLFLPPETDPEGSLGS
jgi:two-component system CheB/CheR fusion protein